MIDAMRADKELTQETKEVGGFLLSHYALRKNCTMRYEDLGRLANLSPKVCYTSVHELTSRGYFKYTDVNKNQLMPVFDRTERAANDIRAPDKRSQVADLRMQKIEAEEGRICASVAWYFLCKYVRDGAIERGYIAEYIKYFGGTPQSPQTGLYMLIRRGHFRRSDAGVVSPVEVDPMTLQAQHATAGYSRTPPSRAAAVSFAEMGNKVGVFTAKCGACGAEVQVGSTKDLRLPTDVVIKLFRNRGWTVHHRNPSGNICPSCQAKASRAPTQEEKAIVIPPEVKPVIPGLSPAIQASQPIAKATFAEPVPTQPAPILPTVVKPVPRALTPKEVRTVSTVLEDRFDDEGGKYEDGWSDAKVAEITNTPVQSVAKFRTEAFGPIRFFPDIDELKRDLAALRNLITDFGKRVADFKSLQQLADDLGRRIANAEEKRIS